MQTVFEALAWTELDLERLLGQPESFRLEFKSGRIFAAREKAVETLSKEVSAFANTEGGVIVLGISDGRQGKVNVAEEIDGVDPAKVATAWLQQAVEGNVSPPVSGMRFRAIPLSRPAGHVCIVIVVPPGSTAHQAQDRRYYGRSEFEARPLADHDVRLRMNKGRVKRARIKISRWLGRRSFKTSDGMTGPADFEQSADVRVRNIIELSELTDRLREVEERGVSNVILAFSLAVVNDGELTIRDLSVEIGFKRDTPAALYIGDDHADIELEMPFRWDLPSGSRIHPQQAMELPLPLWTIATLSPPLGVGDAVLRWTAFVDDGAPERGEIDLAVEINGAAASDGVT